MTGASLRKTSELDFLTKSAELFGCRYSYDKVEYANKSTKVIIGCPKHGDFLQTPWSHMEGHGCPLCHKLRAADAFLERAKNIHGNKYDYSEVEYVGCFDKIRIICKEHGPFLQQPNAHVGKQQQGCPLCYRGREAIRLENLSQQAASDFEGKARKIHGTRYNYSKVKYIRNRFKVEIICDKHGVFLQTPNHHLNGAGCYQCHPGGYNSKAPGYVYVMKSENTVKVGITNKTPVARALNINRTSSKEVFTVVDYRFFEDGSQAVTLEKYLLGLLSLDFKTDTTEKFNGFTECFVGANPENVSQLMHNYEFDEIQSV